MPRTFVTPAIALAATHPALAREWHGSNQLRPTEVLAGSNMRVVWECSHNHVWSATIVSRKFGSGCPFCYAAKRGEIARAARLWGKRSLAVSHPDLVGEWHPSNKVTPDQV